MDKVNCDCDCDCERCDERNGVEQFPKSVAGTSEVNQVNPVNLVNAPEKPFGHSVYVFRRLRIPAKHPLDPAFREERIQIRRRGSRKSLERAAQQVRGFVRLDGEIEAYTAIQWVRAFGTGNERGTEYGQVRL
jgi:hypothetical protein